MKRQRPITWTIKEPTSSLGLALIPSAKRKSWIVNHSTINLSIRRGMTLLAINDVDPSNFNHQQLIQHTTQRPIILTFQPAPSNKTTNKYRTLQTPTVIHLETPAVPIGLELIPLHSSGGWMIASVDRKICNHTELRRGMTLIYANGTDMRDNAFSKEKLILFLQQRPMELIFKPPPRHKSSRRLENKKKTIVVTIQKSSKQCKLGIELIKKKQGNGFMVKQSFKNIRIRRGMTLLRINNIDVNRFKNVNDVVSCIQKITKRKNVSLEFKQAPIRHRSLSPQTRDRHRRHGRTKVVQLTLCGNKTTGLGLALTSRHRGGVVLSEVTAEIIKDWKKCQQFTNTNTSTNTKESFETIPIRRGFTLLSVNGIDVSIKPLHTIQQIIQYNLGTPFTTMWREPPVQERHSRSLSPSIRHRSVSPPPNGHIEVLRILHNSKKHGPMGLELISSKNKRNMIVKHVKGWSFQHTEIRRGMVVQSLNGKEISTLNDLQKYKYSDVCKNNIYIFRSAPAALLSNKQRQSREAKVGRTLFETVFKQDETRLSFGLVLTTNKLKTKILVKKWNNFKNGKDICTNKNLLRRGAELIRIDDVDIRPTATSNGYTVNDVVAVLKNKLNQSVKMVWYAAPPTSLAAKLLRAAKIKKHAAMGHIYQVNRFKIKSHQIFDTIEMEARRIVGMSIDVSARTVIPMIRARQYKIRLHLATLIVDNAVIVAEQNIYAKEAQIAINKRLAAAKRAVDERAAEKLAADKAAEKLAAEKLAETLKQNKLRQQTKSKLSKQSNVHTQKKRHTSHYLLKKRRKKAKKILQEQPKPKELTPEKKPFRICVTMHQTEHDPDNGTYWIKSKELLDGSAERKRIEKENFLKNEKKRKLVEQKLKKQKELAEIKLFNKLKLKKSAQKSWGVLSKMTSASPSKKQRQEMQMNRENKEKQRLRKMNGVMGLPILSTLSKKNQIKINRITSIKDNHYKREQEEAERLMQKVLTIYEDHDGTNGTERQLYGQTLENKSRNNQNKKRIRPKTATPARQQEKSILLFKEKEDEEYYRLTKGEPLFTGGRSPFRERPSSAPRLTPNGRTVSQSEIKSIVPPVSPSFPPSPSSPSSSPSSPSSSPSSPSSPSPSSPSTFNMTDSHRNLIVTTALETIPPELRMQYKPAFVKLLWANAIQLLEDVWDRQVTQKLKYGVKIWKKKTKRLRKIQRIQKSIQLQCWWRTRVAMKEIQERKELKKQREIRRLMIEARERHASVAIQAFYRAEMCRIQLGWKGRKRKRKNAIQKLIILQRRWRGAAAKLLSNSILLLRKRNDQAVRLIQKWYRGCMGRKHYLLTFKLNHLEQKANSILFNRQQYLMQYRTEGAGK